MPQGRGFLFLTLRGDITLAEALFCSKGRTLIKRSLHFTTHVSPFEVP